MKTKVAVKKIKHEWIFVVTDHNGDMIEEFRCKAKTKKEAEVCFHSRITIKERAS